LGAANLTPEQEEEACDIIDKFLRGSRLKSGVYTFSRGLALSAIWLPAIVGVYWRWVGRGFYIGPLHRSDWNAGLWAMVDVWSGWIVSLPFTPAPHIFFDLNMPELTDGAWRLASIYVACLPFAIALFAPIGMPIAAYLERRRLLQIRMAAVEALANIGNVRAVGALAPLLRGGNRALRAKATQALTTLIPKLTEEHYGTFPSDTTPNLLRAFADASEDFRVLLLNALEKIGDGRAIEPLEALSRFGSPREREAASRALPILQERERQANSATNLLRPTHAPQDSSEQLLRPSNERVDPDPKSLLRPTDAE
jgi:hypothetical protein